VKRLRIPGRLSALALLASVLVSAATATRAQDIEPRAYSNAPAGVNFLVAGLAYTRGGIAFDSALPISNPQLEVRGPVVGYAHVLDLWGKSAKFDVIVPYGWLSGSAQLSGQTQEREVDGFGDPRFRLSVNFHGAPALGLKEFESYRQDLIVGASLQVSAPMGQYDRSKVVNLGSNRWFFKPEVGASKAVGPWTLELTAAATFYTDNNDFLNGGKREQDPLYSLQVHTIYGFAGGSWASFDVAYFTGGRTTLNGVLNSDLQQNWRVGGTFSLPLDRHNSVKLYVSSGVSSRTGNDYDLLGIAWQYRWGGGL
jgi:hypothetical protein